tara:strand:+ start:17174 stop:17857 length:684 start_codon:yes stop_codon:yes gene_type:complete
MRIIHNKKLVFLANPKTGTTSIRDILNDYSDVISTNKFPYYHHISACELKYVFKQKKWKWSNYRIICTVRNPWERAISNYFYAKPDKNFRPFYNSNYDIDSRFSHDINSWINYVLRNESYTTREYFFNDKKSNIPFVLRSLHLLIPIKWFCYEGDQLLVNDIIKLEDLNGKLLPILQSIGINITDGIPRKNVSDKKITKLNKDSIELIGDRFKDEINWFNYKPYPSL